MKTLALFVSIIALVGCDPKVRTNVTSKHQPLDFSEQIFLLYTNDSTPDSAELIGEVKISDSGFSSNCNLDVVLEYAKYEARMAGGNLLKIYEHQTPNMASFCHRIKAKILKVENPEGLEYESEANPEWDYALLHIFRPSGKGGMLGYDVHLGDSVIHRAKNNSKDVLEIRKEGLNRIWAKTEVVTEIPVDIEFGRKYYLYCGMGGGIIVGRPELELMDEKTGSLIYNMLEIE